MAIRIGRLRKRSEYLRIAASGRKWAAKGLVLQARACGTGNHHADPHADAWVGFTASRRVGGAVARNRAKRRLRAAAQQVLPARGAANHEYVLIGRRATLTRPFPALLSDLEGALRRVDAMRPAVAAPPAKPPG